jgi:peptidoglycan/xylan/chitin deacetylase (PgdA/CDA1 family)
MEEVRRTGDLLRQIVGQEVTLFRPPYGRLSGPKLLSLWAAGQTVVLWNANPRDFACRTADEVRTWFRNRPLRGGDIVLMHDNRPHAVDVVPDLASSARDRGLEFSTILPWVEPSTPDATEPRGHRAS